MLFEPQHDKTRKMTCVPSNASDQPGHPPTLIRVFAVYSVGSSGNKVPLCGQQRLIRLPKLIKVFAGCKGHFVSFVVQQLNFYFYCQKTHGRMVKAPNL